MAKAGAAPEAVRRQRWTHHQPMPIVSSPPKRMALHQSAGDAASYRSSSSRTRPSSYNTTTDWPGVYASESSTGARPNRGPIADVDQHRHVLTPAALVPPVVHDGGREPGRSLARTRVTPWRSPRSGRALPPPGAPGARRWPAGRGGAGGVGSDALVRGRRSRRGRGREHGGSRAQGAGHVTIPAVLAVLAPHEHRRADEHDARRRARWCVRGWPSAACRSARCPRRRGRWPAPAAAPRPIR